MSTCACSSQCIVSFIVHTRTQILSDTYFSTLVCFLISMLLTLLVAMSHTGSRYDSSIGVNFTDYCCDGHSYSSSTPTPLHTHVSLHSLVTIVTSISCWFAPSFDHIILISLFLLCSLSKRVLWPLIIDSVLAIISILPSVLYFEPFIIPSTIHNIHNILCWSTKN